jgi:hypothetical protein
MSEKTQDTNRTMLYLLGVVVVLLVVIVALVVVNGQNASQPTPTGTPAVSTAATGTQSMPGVKPSTSAPFDPKTATKVAAGVEPKAYVTKYYQSILDKKWDIAFKMQPSASQVGGTAQDFGATQTGYGMTSFKIASATTEGDTATVVAQQDLGANGTWTATWTFVKSGTDWYVKSRQVAMGGQ